MTDKLVVNNNFAGINKAFETDKFGALLEQAYLDGARESKHTQKTSFAPSGLYGKGQCPRFWYYAFNGADFEEDQTALGQANMEYGTEAGKRIATLLERMGVLIEAEKPVEHEDPPIGGFVDAMVKWQGEEIVCEVKTTKQDQFNFRAAKMTVPGYQLIQLLIYMAVFQKKKGFFLTENKNTGEMLIVPVVMNDKNQKIVDGVFDWMRKVHKNALEGELPKRPYTQSSFQCKSCPVKKKCWEGFKRGSVNGEDPNPGTVDLPVLVVPR